LADNSLYGCTFALFTHCLSRFGIQVDLIDFANLDAVKKAIKPNTRIVYFETPTNPTLKVNDIKAIAEIVHNANKDIKVIVDNTFATPLLQKPIELGANIVVHSMTKYINGHGDIIAGCACGSAKDIGEIKMVGIKDATGSVLGADDAYMVNRGLRTLSIRLKKHISNTKQIIAYLQKSPFIKTIYYPGLDTTIGHDAATKQMSDFGAVLSFETNLTFEQTKALVNNVKIITLAVSLGSTESLIEHPASMTHSTYTPEALKEAGISPTLIRLSVGIEDADDLINDLDQAFKIAAK
jgi:methionine-gamma-lyase